MKNKLPTERLLTLFVAVAVCGGIGPRTLRAQGSTIQLYEGGGGSKHGYAILNGRAQCQKFINECREFRGRGGKINSIILCAHELAASEAAFFSEISELKSLTLGDYGGMEVTAAPGAFNELSGLDNVVELTIVSECVRSEDFSFIRSMDSLRELSLGLCRKCLGKGKDRVDIDGRRLFSSIIACKKLDHVSITCPAHCCSFTDNMYARVLEKTKVSSVIFTGAKIGSETFSAAGRSRRLQYFLFGCREISEGDLRSLAESQSLISVVISCGNSIPAASIGQVAAIPTLNTLGVNADVSGDLANVLHGLSESSKIETLELPYWNPQDTDIHSLVKIKELQFLRIGCNQITQRGCRALAERLSLASMFFVGDAAKVDACNRWYNVHLQ